MRRKVTYVFLLLVCMAMLGGCKDKSKTHDMSEISEIEKEAYTEYAHEIVDLSLDERDEKKEELEKKQEEILISTYEKYGMEMGQEIIINGYYATFPDFQAFCLISEERKESGTGFTINGKFKEQLEELPEEGEAVKIKGKLSSDSLFRLEECEMLP